jgi:hypothetical protein
MLFSYLLFGFSAFQLSAFCFLLSAPVMVALLLADRSVPHRAAARIPGYARRQSSPSSSMVKLTAVR